ncbi:glycosyltransferase family A protein [Confluentibacter lentus]|uniref:glycosyltransferase family A protein n=1 Tax=Confluentibacter lentus TaxID=1699412 RepID=UPI000C28C209|nr:glycosyltransferase family A protein [Confluentibacter lentus]
MRVGSNPNKDKSLNTSEYFHQVVIPVYIPNQEGYFKDSFKILKLCIDSLLNTVHNKTFITIVNNGSCQEVKEYLELLFNNRNIHEVIHTENIGKLNAIIKGLVGNKIELVTISDADVLFLSNWQEETIKLFDNIPKAGVVGIVPQFKMYENCCGNVIYETIFSEKLKFLPVKNPEALKHFYNSIGWDRNYNQDYLKYILGLEINSNLNALIGSGHFVATYKKDMFTEIISYLGYKLGGISEMYLDKAPLRKGYWRLTTEDNYAYHMGNTYEDWMKTNQSLEKQRDLFKTNFKTIRRTNKLDYFIKNRLFIKFISVPSLYKLFLNWKGLPKSIAKNY